MSELGRRRLCWWLSFASMVVCGCWGSALHINWGHLLGMLFVSRIGGALHQLARPDDKPW